MSLIDLPTAKAHLRGNHHEGEKQDQGWQMDCLGRFFQAQCVHADQSDRTEQRDACAVQLQEWQSAEDHPKVDNKKNDNNGRCHGGWAWIASWKFKLRRYPSDLSSGTYADSSWTSSARYQHEKCKQRKNGTGIKRNVGSELVP